MTGTWGWAATLHPWARCSRWPFQGWRGPSHRRGLRERVGLQGEQNEDCEVGGVDGSEEMIRKLERGRWRFHHARLPGWAPCEGSISFTPWSSSTTSRTLCDTCRDTRELDGAWGYSGRRRRPLPRERGQLGLAVGLNVHGPLSQEEWRQGATDAGFIVSRPVELDSRMASSAPSFIR